MGFCLRCWVITAPLCHVEQVYVAVWGTAALGRCSAGVVVVVEADDGEGK